MTLTALESRQLASRYASALFDVASTKAAQDLALEQITALAGVIEESQEFALLARSPIIPNRTKQEAVAALAATLGLSGAVALTLDRLAHHNRLTLLPDVALALREAIRMRDGEVAVDVISARALNKSELSSLSDALAVALGKRVEARTHTDASLIGGVKIRYGSVEMDASVKGKLARAAERLYEGIQHA